MIKNYGPSRILTCPHCGVQKEVLSLLSGNTSGGVIWSDQYAEYPFYESPSDIQKCPGCKKFYVIEQEIETPLSPSEIKSLLGESKLECYFIQNTKEYNWERSTASAGNLDFPDILRATIQLDKELDDNYIKRILYLNYIISFNNYFFRFNNGNRIPNPLLWNSFVTIVKKFISVALDSDIIYVAELQREIGSFKACLDILNKLDNDGDDQHLDFRRMIAERAKIRDWKIFKWKTIENDESCIYIRNLESI
jgi:hypothetical protein